MDLQRKEHKDIQQKMQLSQNKLHEHFESIKNAAEKLKYYFGNVQQKEDETEQLREKYYDMLAHKSYNEADRDAYFRLEQDARDEKDMYVQESQKLAFKCSTYVVYSYQHSEEREKFLSTMLKDVDNWYIDYENMKKERQKLLTQSSNLQAELQETNDKLAQSERNLQTTKEENSSLRQKCNDYEIRQQQLLQDRSSLQESKSRLDSTVADMSQRNSNLKSDLNQSKSEAESLNKELGECHHNITIMNKDIDRRKMLQNKANEKIVSQTANIESLESYSGNLGKRNKSLTQELADTKAELTKVKAQRDKYHDLATQAQNDRKNMREKCEKMRREKDEMEEQYGSMRHEREIVGKEKDKMVSREYRIKKRNQELTDDHKTLTRLVDDLREKYRRADERARKDGSLKQELRDTIKRLHKEIEEEKRKHIKIVKHRLIQTDPGLALDSRDIAIQHAQFKMKQAIKARDQYAVDRNRMKEAHDRALKALDRKTHELGSFETKIKSTQQAHMQVEDKLQRAEKVLTATKAELDKLKSLQAKRKQKEKDESERKTAVVEEVEPSHQPHPVCTDAGSQTIEEKDSHADNKAELTLNLALCLQKKVEENKTELAHRSKELDVSKQKISRLEKIIEQQKGQNDTLQRKIIYIEGKFQRDRNYMRTVHNVLNTQALPSTTMRKVSVA